MGDSKCIICMVMLLNRTVLDFSYFQQYGLVRNSEKKPVRKSEFELWRVNPSLKVDSTMAIAVSTLHSFPLNGTETESILSLKTSSLIRSETEN
ncbi:hypothetical protein Sjap_023723 [Stephania japonica]|uniref:Uncharacterized protein n=1 Tax=Stephania japonica TaxID=461633 RepID=A0AAP0EC49_9MAGN